MRGVSGMFSDPELLIMILPASRAPSGHSADLQTRTTEELSQPNQQEVNSETDSETGIETM